MLLDLSHTCHSRAQTGIQRVCRNVFRELARQAATTPITYDPFQQTWRVLRSWELRMLDATEAAAKRGARWPIHARWRGRFRRLVGRPEPLASDGLIVPEVFSPAVAQNLSSLFAQVRGPKVALFHDAIALKYPELSPSGTVARFPSYLRELLSFDAIAAVSEDSRQSLLEFWAWTGAAKCPVVKTLPLGLTDFTGSSPRAFTRSADRPVVLSLGSLEGRKNHLALLEACEALWAQGLSFELHLIGMAHRVTGKPALDRVRRLQSSGRPLRYDGPVSDREVAAAYERCDFTVYPSLMEGFGLPVLEALAHGKPCICSARGALGESAAGGGCLTLQSVDAQSLAEAISRLLDSPELRSRLSAEAASRRFKRWADYVRELLDWMRSLDVSPTA